MIAYLAAYPSTKSLGSFRIIDRIASQKYLCNSKGTVEHI